MTNPVTTSTTSTTAGTQAPASTQNPAGAIDKNTFLKLLVAQVRMQDPTQPTDSSQWLSQMAQFSTVEQLTNMAQTSSDAANASKVTQALSLIGHQVTYRDASGSPATGTVQQVSLSQSGGPTLTISGQTGIDPSTLSEVQ